jgi:hypothetical protein
MSITRWRDPILVLAGALALLPACSRPPAGPMRAENRAVEPFHGIELRGNGEARISVGQPQALAVTTEDSAHPDVVTRVERGVLIVENLKGSWYRSRPTLKLDVAVPQLDSLTIAGANLITLENMSGPRLEILVSGAGSLRAAGEVGALDAQLAGAGDMDLSGLTAGNAHVTVNGAGNVKLHVTGQLEATVNGVGNVSYAGNPREVIPHVNGFGSISPLKSP